QYKVLEILAQAYSPLHQYFLIYENEKDFIVRKMLDDLEKEASSSARGMGMSNFILDFRGQEDAAYCRSFGAAFSLEYGPRSGIREALSSPLAVEVGLPYEMVATAYQDRTLPSLASNFAELTLGQRSGRALRTVLRCDWDTDLF